MFSLFVREVEVRFPEDQLVPSGTVGADFIVALRAQYRPGRRFHYNRDSLVRSWVLDRVTEIAGKWTVDDYAMAQEHVNSFLGRGHHCSEKFYRSLVAHVEFRVSAESARVARQERLDNARLERLKYLKDVLYADPALMVIEHLERNPHISPAEITVADFRKFSGNLRAEEEWWSPLMVAWNNLAEQINSSEEVEVSMRILLDAIRRLDERLANNYGLPPIARDERT